MTTRLSLFCLLLISTASRAQTQTLEELIVDYLGQRGTTPQLAKHGELVRRYSIDLNGVTPSAMDLSACEGKSPSQIFDYFVAKGPMAHTKGERPYVWIQLMHDADHFLFSNSTQFSQVAHVREFRDHLKGVYQAGDSFEDFTRWALESQMFLNRFPSAADRANASFFLFLGRDSLASEVPAGNMWNAWVLKNASIPASQSESNADYHVYEYRTSVCSTQFVCTSPLWGSKGSTPREAIDLMLRSPMFAEATVDRYWRRLIGNPMRGNDFPEMRRALVQGFKANGWNVNWLIKEIATSSAYTQEMMFR